jgi:hypothetical protein
LLREGGWPAPRGDGRDLPQTSSPRHREPRCPRRSHHPASGAATSDRDLGIAW